MWLNLAAIARRLSHDPNVRSIIITGAGDRAFTAGLDVKVRHIQPLLIPPPTNRITKGRIARAPLSGLR